VFVTIKDSAKLLKIQILKNANLQLVNLMLIAQLGQPTTTSTANVFKLLAIKKPALVFLVLLLICLNAHSAKDANQLTTVKLLPVPLLPPESFAQEELFLVTIKTIVLQTNAIWTLEIATTKLFMEENVSHVTRISIVFPGEKINNSTTVNNHTATPLQNLVNLKTLMMLDVFLNLSVTLNAHQEINATNLIATTMKTRTLFATPKL